MTGSTNTGAGVPALYPRREKSTRNDVTLLGRLESRRSVSPALLTDPGPCPEERHRILSLAARVPDHGGLVPWRFIVIEGDARARIAERLGAACLAKSAADDAPAGARAQNTARKLDVLFAHPPLIVIVVMCPDPMASVPVWEQELSAGAACMNLITAATILGFEANWLTGWTATHYDARPVLGLADGEAVAGIIPIGTAMEPPPGRSRPDLARIVTDWTD